MEWRKSSHSGHNGTCIELAGTLDRLRDSKNPSGPVLAVDVTPLLSAIRLGRVPKS